MKAKIGINGAGRIGKAVLRAWADSFSDKFDVVMINDLIDPKSLVHILKYDTVHGRFKGEISLAGDSAILVNGKKVLLSSVKNPAEIPWSSAGVDIVLECTGLFTKREDAALHLKQNGVKAVVISAPAKGADLTMIMGINHTDYDPKKHQVVSNASCTTNCLAPMAKVIHDHFKIVHGFMTTIHSYTNDQVILDRYHKDPRRARAGAANQIITSTGAAKAIGLVLPELKGKLDGISVRVPTPNVSLVDLVCQVEKPATVESVNAALEQAAASGPFKNRLLVSHEPLVSSDFNGETASSIIDALSTSVMDGNFVKVLSWYDNETGFTYRMIELMLHMASTL